MTRKFTFLLMALLTLASFKSWGQTTILSEDFEHEGDFPTGWTATHNSNSGKGWTCTTSNDDIANGYGGTGYSVFCQGSNDKLTDYLTTSAIDFSGYSQVSMSFYFVNRDYADDINELRVEYSVSTSGPWTSLWSNTDGTGNHNSWTAANVDISVLGGGTYYLRFVDVDKWGYGVALDDIVITGSNPQFYSITYDNSIQHGSISGPATGYSGKTITLTATPDEMYELGNWTVTNTTTSETIPVVNNQFTMPESDVTVTATFACYSTLTVNDGTGINKYVPIYGYYVDTQSYPETQFIIPKESLTSMLGGEISKLIFYTNYNCDFGVAKWDIYIGETDNTTLSSAASYDGCTLVYSGNLAITGNKLIIQLDDTYLYEGNNLLVCFNKTQTGTCYDGSGGMFYGVSATDGASGYMHGSWTKQSFLPKTTFKYEIDPNRHQVFVNQPAEGGTISAPATAISGTVVNLTATPEFGYAFGEWITDPVVEIIDNQFVMPSSDITVTATFESAGEMHTITLPDIDPELITGIDALYNGEHIDLAPEGTEITLVYATLNEGYTFNYWTLNGTQLPSSTFTMPDGNAEIGISLTERQRYAVIIDESIAYGTVTASPNADILGNTQVTLTIIPAIGYGLASLSVTDGSGNPVAMSGPGYTFKMPESDATVTATFVPMLTVYDGTTINRNAAVYTYYGDTKNSAAQFVIPASQLEAMAGGTISSLKFYVNPSQSQIFQQGILEGPTYAGYIMEVEETAMSSFIDFGAATNMFNGHVALTNSDSELVIDFAEPFTYTGGNLAIAFECTAKADYTSLYYYGTTVTGGSIYRNGATATATANNFIPKTTFYYTPGEGPEYNAMEITANQDPNHKTHYYSTFYSSTNAYALPEGMTAYTGVANGNVLKLTPTANGIIPAGEAVILRLTTNDNTAMTQKIQLTATTTTATKSDDNMLQGSDEEKTLPQNSYALSLGQNGVGFYKFGGDTLPAHKAYLTYASGSAISLRFSFGDATDIDAIETEAPARAYNLQGQQVDENYKGIVIVNGKKMLNN